MTQDIIVAACSVPAVSNAELSNEARDFVRSAMAANTRRAYAAQLKQWLGHCERVGCISMPADPTMVANWLAARANSGERGGKRLRSGRGQSISTLRTAVAAIRSTHLAAKLPFDSGHPEIMLVLQGIARNKAEAPAQAAPMRGEFVVELLSHMGESPIELRDAAMLALGYCFARRRSELAGLDWQTVGTGDGALSIDAKNLTLRLVRSKTNAGNVVEEYVVPRAQNPIAVSAIERWLVSAKVKSGEPVLRQVHKSGRIGMDRIHSQSISVAIKRRIAEHHRRLGVPDDLAEIEARKFSGHSLRVGFAVTSAEAGADVAAIQRAIGHASPAMASRYSKSADSQRTSPHRLKGVGLILPDVPD